MKLHCLILFVDNQIFHPTVFAWEHSESLATWKPEAALPPSSTSTKAIPVKVHFYSCTAISLL